MEIEPFAQNLINKATMFQATDIYVLPQKERYQLRLRIHQQTQVYAHLSLEEGEQLIRYFKFLSGMDVGEHRRPQLGSCTFSTTLQSFRLRLSTVSNYEHQESLVIRLLYSIKDRSLLFFSPDALQRLTPKVIGKGLHLFCGPVGSGKTTTMYSILKNKAHSHQIITIEDPVEIEEESFLQLQVQSSIHVTYDELIKLCLRHRPDIMMIGEIRDEVTAKYALRAALTGHCVFATLHAPSFQGVRQRLIDLGVKSLDLEQALKTITFVRLLPVYCPMCHYKHDLYCPNDKQHYRCLLVTEDKKGGHRWNERLQHAWLIGAISEQTFLEEYITSS